MALKPRQTKTRSMKHGQNWMRSFCNGFTVSDDILNRILADDTTSRQAWVQIQEIFINNKHARAATLEQQFCNTSLSASSSFDEYCQKLKDIAAQLGDIDQPVSESRFVIQMVRGLPVEFDTIGAIINQNCPTWDQARGMVEAEQQRQAHRSNPSRDSVLIHPSSSTGSQHNRGYNYQQTNDTGRSSYPNGYKGNNYDPAKAARGRGRGGRFSRRGGGGRSTAYSPNWGTTSQQAQFHTGGNNSQAQNLVQANNSSGTRVGQVGLFPPQT